MLARLAIHLVLLWGLLGSLGLAHGQGPEPVRLHADLTWIELNDHAAYFIENEARLDMPGAVARFKAGDYAISRNSEIAAGFKVQGALWLHFRVINDQGTVQTLWFEAADALTDHIQILIRHPHGRDEHREGGRALPFEKRETVWRKSAYKIQFAPGVTDLYVRYDSVSTLRVIPMLMQERRFETYRSIDTLIVGGFFAVMGLTALIVGYRGIRHRSPVDALYALYIVGIDSMNLFTSGLLHQLGHESLTGRYFFATSMLLVGCLALIGFVRLIIEWPATVLKYITRIGLVFGVIAVAAHALTWLAAPRYAFFVVNSVAMLTASAVLVIAAWAYFRKYGNGRIFFLAFLPFLITALIRLSQSFGFVQGGLFLEYLYVLTTVLHAVMLLMVIFIREADIERSKAKLARKVELLREDLSRQNLFFRTLAHEVRTPLAIIDSHVQLLEQDRPEANPSPINQRIRNAVSQLISLVDRLQRLDRIRVMALEEHHTVDLKQLLDALVREAQQRTEHHILRAHYPSGALHCFGDRELLAVMLQNLLENAVRYSPEGGVIEVRVEASKNSRIQIHIADEGVGIPPDALDKIFEPYFRVNMVPNTDGIGLGLHLVQKIARLHDGDVRCQSILGEGSTFIVTLPGQAD